MASTKKSQELKKIKRQMAQLNNKIISSMSQFRASKVKMDQLERKLAKVSYRGSKREVRKRRKK